ncbi:replication protein [Oceanisphaera marina]|uniref:Replication protein n=1 Tax=Oceanisphaera marina TaxID=2017550 RepID=A0ABQ1ITT3_9GAMM|nr:replication protein C, IncQ-type [Oceanisphaera marina]GGB52314.1 replication protein [Oceanisphaera marina]
MPKYDLDHVRHDAIHCLAPGLFRALKRGERRTTKLDVVYEFGKGQRVEFCGPEPLGADDLRVLQGLVALAGLEGRVLSPTPKSTVGVALRQMLEPRWEAAGDNAIVVQCSYRRLAREIGYAVVDCSRPLKVCIERLWKVSIIVQSGEQRRGFRLLADYRSSEELQGVHVALNPLLANAVLGTDRHIRISMSEVRAIKTEAARLLHQRLCAWINIGSSRKVQLVTLCDYLFPHGASGAATRKRLERISQALSELTSLGWQVEEYAKGRLEIRRPPY